VKALLVTMGTYGDMHPYVGLGLRLKQRGHDVVVVSNRHFQQLFNGHGLEFIGLKTSGSFHEFIGNPDLCDPARAWIAAGKWATLEPMREIYQVIAENYVAGNTVVAAPYGSFGSRIAREKLGVPLATVLLCPNDLRSLYRTPVFPKPMVLHDWVPRISKRIQFWLMDRLVVDRIVGPATNAFRRELELPPLRGFLSGWCFSPDRIIGFFPDWYSPYQPDWPRQTVLTGFPRWDPGIPLQEHRELYDFVAGGDPPLVFTPGSYNRYGEGFLHAAVECCASLGRRGILLTRYRDQLPKVLPQEVMHFEYAPFDSLLPHAAALVSHGGIGTVAQALAAGVPQILMPIAFNQPDEAVRLKRLGVADFIHPKHFSGLLLTKKMRALISSALVAERCRDLAERFHNVDPIEQACQLLENLRGVDLKSDLRARQHAFPLP
jgi:rhamnosyltransferase subunit B